MLLSSLNDDVLNIVTYFMALPDVQCFRLTCRYAYAVSMPRYLSDVSITTSQQLAGFCAFMLSSPSHRPPLLKRFHIGVQYPKNLFQYATELSDILRHSSTLRSLTVVDLENLLFCEPSLTDALSKLTSLDHVSFSRLGELSYRLLSRIASRPCHVELHMFNYRLKSLRGHILDHFTECLQTLEIRLPLGFVEDLNKNNVWPYVHNLHLECPNDTTTLSSLARAFPNVQCLRLTEHSHDLGQPPYWPSLDYVDVSDPIKLSCRVRRLAIRNGIADILPMLRGTLPVVLTCVVTQDVVAEIPETVPDLLYLKIGIQVDIGATVDPQNSSLHIARSLRGFPLIALSLCFPEEWPTAPNCDISSLAMLALQIVSELPTLGHIGFDAPFTRDPTRVRRWFRVTSQNNSLPQVRLLASYEAHILEERLNALVRA